MLAPPVSAAGGSLHRSADGWCVVTGLPVDRVGELAHEHRVLLYEIGTVRSSLEDAFMELTADRADHRSGDPR